MVWFHFQAILIVIISVHYAYGAYSGLPYRAHSLCHIVPLSLFQDFIHHLSQHKISCPFLYDLLLLVNRRVLSYIHDFVNETLTGKPDSKLNLTDGIGVCIA